ncbi:MAG TPA: class I SAM-dependent RNA methyltransferase [Methylomirabilota bacterium]|nr:class I SAM-dependent RNA methyltransferase [Methylomirabilota bacterium]
MSVEPSTVLAIGQRVTVRIHDVAFGGDGVGRVAAEPRVQGQESIAESPALDARPSTFDSGSFVVFVPFTAVGEEVEVEITEVKKNFARGKIAQLLHSSASRVAPVCPYFGMCGGCQYQHLDYATQLALKHKQVSDLFERIGKFRREIIRPIIGCPQPYFYRNRIMIRSQWNKPEQKLNIGYLRWDCGLVVDIDKCPIAEPALNEEILRVRLNPPPKGGLKVVLRIPPEDWDVPPDSFFQNNFFLLPQLVSTARDCLKASGAKYLIDVYCGVGFFGISLADRVDKFIGVEIDKPAIKAARNNMLRHNRLNGEFVLGDAQVLLPSLLQEYPANDTAVILDPPRVGVPKSAIEQLRAIRPKQIIYVSCHPATLARDLNLLCENGVFELRTVTPLDMFPQTQHVECVADVRLAETGSNAEGRESRAGASAALAPRPSSLDSV